MDSISLWEDWPDTLNWIFWESELKPLKFYLTKSQIGPRNGIVLSLKVEYKWLQLWKEEEWEIGIHVEHCSFVHLFTEQLLHERHSYCYCYSPRYAYTCSHTPTHSHVHVLMYTCMGGCTGGMESIGQMPAGKPTRILSLRHWESHGSLHKVAANIKEHWDCSRTGSKDSYNPEVLWHQRIIWWISLGLKKF